jgi:diguanylate cyclase (GGDEF)-like protein/PAS domain S-box-containing protein
MTAADDDRVLRRLAEVSAEINRGRPLNETLQAVVDGVVAAVGFGAAVVNFVRPDGDLMIAAVAAPDGAHSLLGRVIPRAAIDDLLARATPWGALRFIDQVVEGPGESFVWIPEKSQATGPGAWHTEDSLLAPLHGGDGALVGVLSVDLPSDGQRPSTRTCELLEMFAVQAGIAIDNARLVDALRQERDHLAASEAAFRFFFTASAGAMGTLSLDPDDPGRIRQVNEAFARLFGYPAGELEGISWTDLVVESERAASRIALAAWRTGDSDRRDRHMRRKDGTTIWALVTATAVTPDSHQPPLLLVHVDDITDRKTREAELSAQAHRDPLTGLPNRRTFLKHLRAALVETTPASAGAVIYADLNNFKSVNDTYGHAVGDQVLCETASRLTGLVREADVVARLGGDEFAVITAGVGPHTTEELLTRIRRAFDRPRAEVPDHRPVTISVGMVTLSDLPSTITEADAEELLHRADLAMYDDKNQR